MRVCFLTPSLPARPPVADYAQRLGATLAQTPPDEEFDVAVATDWTTTAHLFGVRAERYVFWVDHFAHRRMGTWQAERFAAQLAYDLPVDFIAAAPWIRATLQEVRPEARCELVTIGAPAGAAASAAAAAAGAAEFDAAPAPGPRAGFTRQPRLEATARTAVVRLLGPLLRIVGSGGPGLVGHDGSALEAAQGDSGSGGWHVEDQGIRSPSAPSSIWRSMASRKAVT